MAKPPSPENARRGKPEPNGSFSFSPHGGDAAEGGAGRWEVEAPSSYLVAGVDEAGRGCLAGPVVAAAVILRQGTVLPDLTDSKLLTAAVRDRLAEKNEPLWQH